MTQGSVTQSKPEDEAKPNLVFFLLLSGSGGEWAALTSL